MLAVKVVGRGARSGVERSNAARVDAGYLTRNIIEVGIHLVSRGGVAEVGCVLVEASGQGGLQWRPAQVLGGSVVRLAPATLGLKLQGHKSVGTVGGHHNREAVVNIVLGLKPQPNTGGIIDRQGRLLGP